MQEGTVFVGTFLNRLFNRFFHRCFSRTDHLSLDRLLVAAVLSAGTLAAHAQEGLATPSAVARDALARHRDANGILALSAEGRALYERDVIKLDGYGYCGRSIALAEQGEFRQSIRAAAKALHLGSTQDNEDLRSLAQRDLAIAYSYAGLLDEAERFAQGSLALRPKNPQQAHAPSLKVLGDVAARRGRYGDAADAYKRSFELASDKFRPLVLLSLANAYTAAGRPREALEQLDRLPAPEAQKLGAFHDRSRANALLAAGQPEPALALFRQVAQSGGAATGPPPSRPTSTPWRSPNSCAASSRAMSSRPGSSATSRRCSTPRSTSPSPSATSKPPGHSPKPLARASCSTRCATAPPTAWPATE
jgi:hypothetical protein